MCGGVLGEVGIGRRHRVEELVSTVKVTKSQCMCPRRDRCGRVTKAPLPARLGGAPKAGPHAQVVAMSLRFDADLPVSAISRVFVESFGLPLSPDRVSQLFERNMAKLEPATVEVRNHLLAPLPAAAARASR